MKFKIIETGGRSIKSRVSYRDQTLLQHIAALLETVWYVQEEGGRGGDSRQFNVQYKLDCQMCPKDDRCTYIGKTLRNWYTISKEHIQKYKGRKTKTDHFITKHQGEWHGGVPADFRAKVTGKFADCLSRQVSECVSIRWSTVEILNSKSEWH